MHTYDNMWILYFSYFTELIRTCWILQYTRYCYIIILLYTSTDENVGFVIPVAGKQGVFVIGLGTTLAKLQWNLNEKTHQVIRLTTVDNDKPGNRWNDAKADINGYLWAGNSSYYTTRAKLQDTRIIEFRSIPIYLNRIESLYLAWVPMRRLPDYCQSLKRSDLILCGVCRDWKHILPIRFRFD